MKPPVRAGGGRRTERYRGARRKRTRLPFAGVGKPERPRNPSAYNTPGSIEPPGEGARDEATLPGRRQAGLDPPQGTGRKWRAFGPPDMFSRAARPVGPPREFCWRPGPRQRPAASRRFWESKRSNLTCPEASRAIPAHAAAGDHRHPGGRMRRPPATPLLQLEDRRRSEDEAQGDDGDRQLREGADHEGTQSLLLQLAEVGLESDAGEGEEKRPAREVREIRNLWSGKGAERREQRDEEEPEYEFGELLPDEQRLVRHFLRLAFRRPVDGVGEDDEADHRVARGLGEDGDLAGHVRVHGTGGGGLRGVVHREPRPDPERAVAHVQRVSDERIGEEPERSEREDGGDRERRVVVVRVDGGLRGDDGRDAADRRSDREKARQLRPEMERFADERHDGDGDGKLDGDEAEGDSAQAEDV